MAVNTVVNALTDFFFSNLPQDRFQGLQIWTDQSASDGAFISTGRNEIVRVQVAPQNIQFIQRSRISEQMIKDGRAFFFWRKDRFSSHLDLLELNISGITRSLAKEPRRRPGGPIDAVREVLPSVFAPSSGGEDGATPKQQEWLRFYRLTREPFIVEDKINHHNIRLETPALPIPVTFVGHFTSPIQWGEVADNPFLVTWQLGLIVHRTEPDLEQLFQQAITVNVQGTAFGGGPLPGE